jgi:hypothetical protein
VSRGYELILEGEYEQALRVLKRHVARQSNDGFNLIPPIHLGMAYLLTGRYAEAESHFQKLINTYRTSVSLHFIGLGMARWFQRNRPGAVDAWVQGFYARESSIKRLEIPFMLFYAGAHRPDLFDPSEAELLISEIVSTVDSEYYPYVIGKFLIGQLDDGQFNQQLRVSLYLEKWPDRINDHKLVASFYTGVRHLRNGNRAEFESRMRECAAVRGCRDRWDELVIAHCEVAELSARIDPQPVERQSASKRTVLGNLRQADAATDKDQTPAADDESTGGKFYANIVVRNALQARIKKALAQQSRTALLVPGANGNVIVFDAAADESEQELWALAETLSTECSATVWAVLIHDDDVLQYHLYVAGEFADEYDSTPGYFNIPAQVNLAQLARRAKRNQKPKGPEGGRPTLLCEEFGATDRGAAVRKILRSTQYAFQTERHRDLVRELGLPELSVGNGYRDLAKSKRLPKGTESLG